jgi:cell division protein FtsL|uniref:Cell division protein FtsL n=1 Tax=Desulfobacca acetoxidans TaxID=60893 RepID=A0A7C3Z473_9BACT
MPTNLALRLSTVSHTLIARNRKVRTQESPWQKILVLGLILAAVGIVLTSFFWAWGNLQSTALNYQISQAKEMQKEYLELNRKLRVELSNLTSIARLEKLAETYSMGPPAPGQVVKVNWQ